MKKTFFLLALVVFGQCATQKQINIKTDATKTGKPRMILYTYPNMDYKAMGIDTSKYHNR